MRSRVASFPVDRRWTNLGAAPGSIAGFWFDRQRGGSGTTPARATAIRERGCGGAKSHGSHRNGALEQPPHGDPERGNLSADIPAQPGGRGSQRGIDRFAHRQVSAGQGTRQRPGHCPVPLSPFLSPGASPASLAHTDLCRACLFGSAERLRLHTHRERDPAGGDLDGRMRLSGPCAGSVAGVRDLRRGTEHPRRGPETQAARRLVRRHLGGSPDLRQARPGDQLGCRSIPLR